MKKALRITGHVVWWLLAVWGALNIGEYIWFRLTLHFHHQPY
jgi:hypothetical protein